MTVAEFFAAAGSGYNKDDADIIGRELRRLSRLGHATTEQILAAARADDSPLHRYFEWDDTLAAERYRLQQAGHLARSIHVAIIGDDGVRREMRAFYPVVIASDENAEPGKRQYVPIEVLAAQRPLAEQVRADLWRQLVLWRAKARDFDDFFTPIFEAIDQLAQERAA